MRVLRWSCSSRLRKGWFQIQAAIPAPGIRNSRTTSFMRDSLPHNAALVDVTRRARLCRVTGLYPVYKKIRVRRRSSTAHLKSHRPTTLVHLSLTLLTTSTLPSHHGHSFRAFSTRSRSISTMRVPTACHLALAMAFGACGVASMPHQADVPRALDCNMPAIENCAAVTGNDETACFGHLCAGKAPRKTKRQDQCNEENLENCAILEWKEAQVCFEQLCL
ncbi:hypothetical protein F5Y15DRAFT_394218 [Xylariaceae sp. FL0016]|nr:hypothetical protein F5Y15DRAFT_394218 [Xylariaceae sp. FL0016]